MDNMLHNGDLDRAVNMQGGKGRVSKDDGSFDREFWAKATPEQRIQAMFELRRIYYEVLHPRTGDKRLDRTVGGT